MSVLIKNLIPYPYDEFEELESDCTLIDNGDGSITFNGTGNGYTHPLKTDIELPAGDYVLSVKGDYLNGCFFTFACDSYSDTVLYGLCGGETVKVTFTEGAKVTVIVSFYGTADNLTLTPYIQEYNTAYKLATIAENEQKVFDAGKDAAMQRYWDIRQDYGKREGYDYFFCNETPETLAPRYDMRPTNMEGMFRHNYGLNIDLVAHLENLGVELDTSNCTNMNHAFHYTALTKLGILDFRKCGNKTQATFSYSQGIHTIELVIVSDDGTQTFVATYDYLRRLKEIRFQGAIGRSVSFQHSTDLSVASMKDIIAHLVNYAGTSNAGKYTLTLPTECWERLEADSTAPDGGTWQNYVKNLGWLV